MEAKQRWSVIGWVTKNLLSRAPPYFRRHVKLLHLARVVGYEPFSLWVIREEGQCPSSGDGTLIGWWWPTNRRACKDRRKWKKVISADDLRDVICVCKILQKLYTKGQFKPTSLRYTFRLVKKCCVRCTTDSGVWWCAERARGGGDDVGALVAHDSSDADFDRRPLSASERSAREHKHTYRTFNQRKT
jgi:hypothetical protein